MARSCAHCGDGLPTNAHGSMRYCSDHCRDAASWARRPKGSRRYPSREVPCALCDTPIQRSRPSKRKPICRACRDGMILSRSESPACAKPPRDAGAWTSLPGAIRVAVLAMMGPAFGSAHLTLCACCQGPFLAERGAFCANC